MKIDRYRDRQAEAVYHTYDMIVYRYECYSATQIVEYAITCHNICSNTKSIVIMYFIYYFIIFGRCLAMVDNPTPVSIIRIFVAACRLGGSTAMGSAKMRSTSFTFCKSV